MKRLVLLMSFMFTLLYADVNCVGSECGVKKDMKFWGVDLYHFDYSVDKNGNEKVKLTYKREIPKEKNVEKANEKFSQNNKVTGNLKKLLKEWNSHLIDTKIGSVYEIVVNKHGTTMLLNKKRAFKTKSRSFGKMYIKMWSGKNPIDNNLRDSILLAKNEVRKR